MHYSTLHLTVFFHWKHDSGSRNTGAIELKPHISEQNGDELWSQKELVRELSVRDRDEGTWIQHLLGSHRSGAGIPRVLPKISGFK